MEKSYLVIGKGSFFEDILIAKLTEWGFDNPLSVLKRVEGNRNGSVECNGYTIALVK